MPLVTALAMASTLAEVEDIWGVDRVGDEEPTEGVDGVSVECSLAVLMKRMDFDGVR